MAPGVALIFGLLLVVSACIGYGCRAKVDLSNTYIGDIKACVPLFSSNPSFTYLLDGTKVDATFKKKTDGAFSILELIAHGKVLEREVYEIRDDEILLVESLGEVYDPPIRLLKFPLSVGEQYDWEGKMKAYEEVLDCKAKTTTNDDTLRKGGRTIPAVQVVVALTIRQGDLTIDRRLAFWFVQGDGVLKRQFGVSERTVEE